MSYNIFPAIGSVFLASAFAHSFALEAANAQKKQNNDEDITITRFSCQLHDETRVPTTFMHFTNKNGNRKLGIISWKLDFNPDWSPMKRCNAVSKRLDSQYQQRKEQREGLPAYLNPSTMNYRNTTSGALETANVICFAESSKDQYGSSECTALFLTLLPSEDPKESVRELERMFGTADSGVVPTAPVRGDGISLNNFLDRVKASIRNGSAVTYPSRSYSRNYYPSRY